jgi:outer membrane cobalamin receptor
MKRLLLLTVFMVPFLTVLSQNDDHKPLASAPKAVKSSGRMDSIQRVQEVVITSKLTFREVIPSQQLKGAELERLSALSVADAIRYFAGVQLKDYGGVGGVKTVDVRAMGTNHLAVSYDGIVLGNAQNGQTDLGQFSLDNIEEVTLYNGQKSAIFQAASDFASASSVYIRTKMPRFEVGRQTNLKLHARYGGSDLLRTSLLWEQRLSDDLSMSTNAEVMTASGKYSFRYRRKNLDGTTAWDTTATRQNGDIHAERLEINLHGILEQGQWQLKGYLYNSARGIPGAIVNNVWSRGERQQDLNTFCQASWQKSFGDRFSTRWLAKYAFYQTGYQNRDTTVLPVDNTYRQQEVYLSTANVVELLPGWSASMSYDLRWNKLNASVYRFAYPTRLTHTLSAATALDYGRIKIQASLAGQWINDWSKQYVSQTVDNTTTNTQITQKRTDSQMTPALFANIYPFRGKWLSLRAYVKQSYRMPTFNDLYYNDLGNASLRPERATQFDVGLLLNKHFKGNGAFHLSLQTDLYFNKVKDKIIAYPKGQQFRWTMLNLGEVDIRGIDMVAAISGRPFGMADLPNKSSVCRDLIATLRMQYTYQRAIDITDASKPFYRHQIPYIPRHAGSLIMGLDWPRLSLNYSFIYTGERWNAQVNNDYNHMQPWYTSDLQAAYRFQMKKCELKASLEINNLLDQQYDVIANYPMPGRNYSLSVVLFLMP